MCKLPHNCTHFTCQPSNAQNSPSQASAVHEPRTSRFSNWIQKRQRNQKSNCQHLLDHRKSKRIPKNIYFCFIDYTKAFVWITTNCGMFLKRWEYQTTLPASRETCMQEKKRELEPDMEQKTGSKLGKEYIKAVYCHSAYFTYKICRLHHMKCQAG